MKDDGGWTLEQIDPPALQQRDELDREQRSQGGTPGTQNSVFAVVPDLTPPVLTSVQVNSDTEIDLVFNEAMDPASTARGELM
jgi:hypothetical protein